jgi:WD40 repeat protein
VPYQVVRIFGDLRFHTDGDVVALAFDAAGILRSVEEPGVLRQWNLETGRALASHFLSDLETLWQFSADARVLVSASDDLSLWDVASGQMLAAIPRPSWVSAVGLRSDMSHLATGHDDGVVRVWDTASRRQVHEFRGHDQPVGSLAFSPDGTRLASAAEDRLIHLWDLTAGKLLGTFKGHTDRIDALAWHPGGHMLVSAAWDRTAREWNVVTFEPIILLNTHDDQVTTLAFSRDGSLLACADSANSIHIWDPVAGKERHILKEHGQEIHALAFSYDGQMLASGGADRVIRLWKPATGEMLAGPSRPVLPRTHLVVSPDDSRLFSTCGGANLTGWNTMSGEQIFPPPQASGGRQPPVAQARVLAGSPDGKWLASGGDDNRVYLWNSLTGQLQATFEGQAGEVTALAFAPDSQILASASSREAQVWIWNVVTGQPVLVIPEAADACTVEALAFHPQGKILAAGGIDWLSTGGSDGAICLWDLDQKSPLATFNRGTVSLAFHPSGQKLASASLRESVCIWDLTQASDGQQPPVVELTGHADAVTCVAYSPDGRWLVSGSDDRSVRIWNADTGECVSVQELETPIKGLCFSPDGRYLFTGNGNTTSCQLELQALLDDEADPALR